MRVSFRAKDFLGVSDISGDFEEGGVCRISGTNASGKSSTLMSIGICMAQEPNPYKLNVGQMPQYAHNGSLVASSELTIGDWFSVGYTVRGGLDVDIQSGRQFGPVKAVEVCAGLVDPLENWRQKEWNALFRSVMIDYETFANALLRDWDGDELTGDAKKDEANKEARVAAQIYEDVKERGLSAVLDDYRERLRNSKRDWSNIASGEWGKNDYGEKKSYSWRPPGWHESWSQMSAEEVHAEVAEAREHLDLVKSQLIQDETIRHHHEELSSKLVDRKETAAKLRGFLTNDTDIGKKEQLHTDATNERQKIQERLNDIKRKMTAQTDKTVAGHRHKCPHCAGGVVLIGGELVVYDEAAEEALDKELVRLSNEADKVKLELSDKNAYLSRIVGEIKEAKEMHMKDIRRADLDVSASQESANWLKSNPATTKNMTADDVSAAENKLTDATNRQRMVGIVRKSLNAADACHECQRIIASLDKGSVSKEFERMGMGGLRTKLSKLGALLGFHVELEGGVLTYGGRVISFCSESEKWIARFAVQLALAAHFKIPLVLADRFDVLDEENTKKYLAFFDSRNEKKGRPGALSIIVAGTDRAEQESGDLQIVAGKREYLEKPTGETES